MPIKKSNKVATSVCPHADCQASFLTPVIEKGILFCPHCARSLLIEKSLNIIEFNKEVVDKHKKYKSWSYGLPETILVFTVLAPMVVKYVYDIEDIYYIYLSMIYVCYFLYMILRSSQEKIAYRLKYKTINILEGVDTLSDVRKFTEIKTDYVDKKGVLAQAHCYHYEKPLPDLKNCPCCTSQLVVKLTEVAGWRKDLYSKYDIFRPTFIPYSGYCAETDSYADNDYILDKMLLCLHCHTHYSWVDIETDTLFKSAEGAPQLHKI